uniref:Uncharacterized protein n=1 Tax=Arundo donax TaxID=35708 RepID=A0A0A8XXJ5_ARUDO
MPVLHCFLSLVHEGKRNKKSLYPKNIVAIDPKNIVAID